MKSDTDGNVNSRPRMELKYCERCGGLWVREYGSARVYCKGCRPLIAQLPPARLEHDWLESRRAKLLFRIAQEYERTGEIERAITHYRQCGYPGARLRAIRALEHTAQQGVVSAAEDQSVDGRAAVEVLPNQQFRLGGVS